MLNPIPWRELPDWAEGGGARTLTEPVGFLSWWDRAGSIGRQRLLELIGQNITKERAAEGNVGKWGAREH